MGVPNCTKTLAVEANGPGQPVGAVVEAATQRESGDGEHRQRDRVI
jgi:hypothetical protein